MPAPWNNPKALTEWYELDYFRRPRHPHVKVWMVLGALAISAAAVAVAVAWPGGRVAFQAGPLSDAHAFLADNCAACHTEAFTTARRLLPANAAARATPDAACTQCHDAGNHSPFQTLHTGPDGQAADCASCHREHRGFHLTRLDDTHCTKCHGNLPTSDGKHRFQAGITHFDTDHPPFATWRGQLSDPGTIKFNHKVHLELAESLKDIPRERLGGMAEQLQRLKDQSCTYCHQPDTDRRFMLPVSFENHCAACHALSAGDWKVPHPRRSETAAVVRGFLLERAWNQIAATQPAAGAPPDRPPVLQRGLPPLSADQRERARQQARQAEDRLFATDGGDVLFELERPLFRFRGGCAYCHRETTTPETRRDGLPDYALPRLHGRWDDVTFPHERFGPANGVKRSGGEQAARDRWFPYSRFGHEKHRMLDCGACHDAKNSTGTEQVLLPKIEDCRQCHNRATTGVRSDCLECHTYHDRGVEPRGLRGWKTIDDVLGSSKR